MSAATDFGETHAARLERVYDELSAVLRDPDVARRRRAAPGEGEWSALQIIGHMTEMIPYWLHHCQRLIAAGGAPPSFGRTPDSPERLAGVEQATTREPEEALRLLHREVQAAAEMIRSLSPADLGRKGAHIVRGEMTVGDVVSHFVVAHAEEHLAQVRAALGA